MFRKKLLLVIILLVIAHKANAGQEIRLGIMPFLSRTESVSERQAAFISDIMARNFQASPSIAVIERERLRVIAGEQ